MDKFNTLITFQKSAQAAQGGILAAWLLFTACATGMAWADTPPSTVNCRITGVPLQFERIDPLQSAPQPGQGHILVDCTNNGHQHQEVALAVFDGKAQQRQLSHARFKQVEVTLSLFVDPERQRRLADMADAQHTLRLSTQLSPNSNTQLKLPFFALVELSALVPAGVYARPFDLDLVYQTRVIQPAATPKPLRTAALAGTGLDYRPAQQR